MALSSCLLPGGKLIVAVQTLFFICSLRCRYSIRQAIAHTIYSAYDVIAYTVYCAMDGCHTLAITHNPEAAGSSPVPVTMFNRWFCKKSAVFCIFQRFWWIRTGALAPIVPQRGVKLGKWILWRLQNMCRYFVFKWFMRYNICTCPLCNPPMRLIYLHSIILADYKNRREKLLYEVSP